MGENDHRDFRLAGNGHESQQHLEARHVLQVEFENNTVYTASLVNF
jgi:hypothetical protein